jgi:integrase
VFAEACDEVPVPSGERLDLRPLGPHLRLEIQYAVQRRHDEQKIKIEPRLFQRIARFLAEVQVTSLLDWSEAAWRRRMSASWIGVHPRSLLIEARRQIEILTVGTGWDVEYPRDHWRLRTLGINDGSTANLRFGQISQPWLKNLAKQWARWRLTSGLSSAAVYRDVRAITRFSDFLTDPAVGVGDISQITRPLLERYLADLHADYGGGSTHSDHISGLSGFLTGIRRHGWNNSLPATAVFFPEDYPKPAQRLPRALAEHVMAQVENPDNLDRFDNPAFRLITIVLIQCGLRVKDAVRLPYDCLTEDHDGAPYLRYFNHKMKREALVPIDTALRQHIREQQQRLRKQRPEGVPVLFPRRNANLDATRPVSPTTYRVALREWLQRCDVRDENGNPVHLTPHQWRHTLGTRLINRDVPQEVVRKILDHDSAEMTAHYARLSDTTIRRHWEQARKVNIRGETVTFSPDGPLSDAAWAKHRLGHATQTLPNGYCGLPLVKTCQHANACLTCPMFITTVEFLPHHEAHHQQTLQLIAAAEARDQKRLAEMNRTVATNLEKIISSLRDDGTNRPETAADAS